MTRLYIYAAIALALAGLAWRYHYVTKALASTKQELATAAATLAAERENTRKANEASKAYQSDLARLERERADVPVVRLCNKAPSLPSSRAPSRPDAASAGHVGEAAAADPGPSVGPDIGGELLDYGIACEANMLQLERLQQWVRDR